MDQADQAEENSQHRRTWQEWLASDLVLGTLVVLFTITTALAAYLSSITGIAGDDFDLEAQNSLIVGSTTFLQISSELSQDLALYTSAQLLQEEDPTAASELLTQASPDFQEWLGSGRSPYDDEYRLLQYAEARQLLDEAQDFQAQGNQADEESERYERAAFILAVGLALTAWASLYDDHPQLRLTFTLLAMPCLLLGIGILLTTLVSSQV